MSLPKKRGRPSKYTEAVATAICRRIADGETLREICRSSDRFPPESSVREWVLADHQGFAARYARAREQGYEHWASEILQISDADYRGPDGQTDNGAVQQARLQCDVRRWLLSKLLPTRYGDRVVAEITGDPDRPVVNRVELIAVPARHAGLIIEEEGGDAASRLLPPNGAG